MKNNGSKSTSPATPLLKCPTGIQGLDEITGGGLPRGRPTLVCGGAGCGKTLFAAEFLVRGAAQFGEPGPRAIGESGEMRKRRSETPWRRDSRGLRRMAYLSRQARRAGPTTEKRCRSAG